MQRITISLPEYLYENLLQLVPTGQVSSFVAGAVEKELIETESDPFEDFIKLREKLPKKGKAAILKAIEKGRSLFCSYLSSINQDPSLKLCLWDFCL
jgi:hypothetical protein